MLTREDAEMLVGKTLKDGPFLLGKVVEVVNEKGYYETLFYAVLEDGKRVPARDYL